MQLRAVSRPFSLQCRALISQGLLLLLLAGLRGRPTPAWEWPQLSPTHSWFCCSTAEDPAVAPQLPLEWNHRPCVVWLLLPSAASSPPFPSPSPSIPSSQVHLSCWWTGNPQFILALRPLALLTLGLFTCGSWSVNSLPTSAWMTCPAPSIPPRPPPPRSLLQIEMASFLCSWHLPPWPQP